MWTLVTKVSNQILNNIKPENDTTGVILAWNVVIRVMIDLFVSDVSVTVDCCC